MARIDVRPRCIEVDANVVVVEVIAGAREQFDGAERQRAHYVRRETVELYAIVAVRARGGKSIGRRTEIDVGRFQGEKRIEPVSGENLPRVVVRIGDASQSGSDVVNAVDVQIELPPAR